jgi:selenide, water dikinase
VLGALLKLFTPPTSDKLLVGIDGVDDAGVYQLTDDLALVQTVDFFPPIVDDPFTFGQVAAANALSDVYAMGGRPVTALNILGFPAKMPVEVIGEILRGGAEKVAEAGAVIAGGHSVKDNELKYGLAVTGLIHPQKIMANKGARPGDWLILTKPIGTGILSTAVKRDLAQPDEIAALTRSMTALNKIAGEAMVQFGAHAATDITGFGLAGHAYEMAHASQVTFEIVFERLRLLPGAAGYAQQGVLTGGGGANRQYLADKVNFAESLRSHVQELVFDPQTSGGLLIAIGQPAAEKLLRHLLDLGLNAADIGRVLPFGRTYIEIV